jgi:hypothetical protein
MTYLHNLPAPKITWLDRCLGDKRLIEVFTKGMGYKPEDLIQAEKDNVELEEPEEEENDEE